MAISSFYFDEMMSREAAKQLTNRGRKIVMAVDVEMVEKDHLTEHLPYATEQGLVLVTFDRFFAGRASKTTDHAGILCLTISQDDIGGIVRAITEFAERYSPDEVVRQVFWY
jgi:hypothetical protein